MQFPKFLTTVGALFPMWISKKYMKRKKLKDIKTENLNILYD